MVDPVVTPSSSSPPASAPAPVTSPPASISPPNQAATTPAATSPAPAVTPPAAPTRPDGVPEKYWTAEKGVDHSAWAKEFNEYAAFKAAEDSKRLTLPAAPEAYKVALPEDFKPPAGVEFKFNEADPLLAQARTLAHTLGIPQEGFSKLLGLYAGAQVATEQQIATARNAEIAKLGATGPARVDAIVNWSKATFGEGDGQRLASLMATARDVEIFEKVLARVATQGSGAYRASGREPDIGGKVDDATWDKMSYTERKQYAERHSARPN